MDPSPARPDRALVVILSVIAALVAIALAVVFLRGTPKMLDRSTPEGVVQAYTTAIIDGDRAEAKEYLSEDLRQNCQIAEPWMGDGIRVTLADSTIDQNTATVDVVVVSGYGSGPFGSSETESRDVFQLVKEGDSWTITTAPWQLTLCYDTGK